MISSNLLKLTSLQQFLLFILVTSIALISCSSDTIEERDDQGKLVAHYDVRDDVKHGKYIGYHTDGSVFEECTYVHGEVHGIRSLYYEGNKKLQTAETYDNGVMDGLFEEYHINGKVALTGLYVDDAMEGVWKKYNESGQLLEEVSFTDSEENGPFKEYHINGQLAAEGGYLNGDNEHGPLKIYNELGELLKEMDCDNGICKTTWSKEASK